MPASAMDWPRIELTSGGLGARLRIFPRRLRWGFAASLWPLLFQYITRTLIISIVYVFSDDANYRRFV